METNDILKEILKWQRIQGISILKPLLLNLLDSKEKRRVYEMTDGTLGVKDISKEVKIATGTISNWWNKWLAEGILSRDGVRYTKIISLKDINLESQEKNE